MNQKSIRKIVIVGGGTAGWMAAAPLAQRFGGADGPHGEIVEIVLIESPEIGTMSSRTGAASATASSTASATSARRSRTVRRTCTGCA